MVLGIQSLQGQQFQELSVDQFNNFNQILIALNFSYKNQFQFGAYSNLNRGLGINLGYRFSQWMDDFIPYIQTSIGISGPQGLVVLGPSFYVAMIVSKKIIY